MHVLSGKFTGDQIEGPFGWYSQIKWWQLAYVNSPLFEAETKIRCLSLLRQNGLYKCIPWLT